MCVLSCVCCVAFYSIVLYCTTGCDERDERVYVCLFVFVFTLEDKVRYCIIIQYLDVSGVFR